MLDRLAERVDPLKDDFGIDATRFVAAVAQPTIVGLRQHGVRRLLLAGGADRGTPRRRSAG